MNSILRVGSRESMLAVRQATLVMDAIRRKHPGVRLELVTMKTTGDRILDRALDTIGGKGLFIKELDQALAEGRIDLAVHSYKDMPVPDNPDLPVVAVSARENPYDVLVVPDGRAGPDFSKPLGTGSQRRLLQLRELRDDGGYSTWTTAGIRGNIQTRLRRLDRGEYGGLILAAAALTRLDLTHRIQRQFTVEEMIPAPCQGILAIQGRAGRLHPCLDAVHCPEAALQARAERAFVTRLEGGCTTPTAAFAVIDGEELYLHGAFLRKDGMLVKGHLSGKSADAEDIGKRLADMVAGDKR